MSKSSFVKVRTNFPSLSVTIASTSTLSVSARKIAGAVCGGGAPWGACAMTTADNSGTPTSTDLEMRMTVAILTRVAGDARLHRGNFFCDETAGPTRIRTSQRRLRPCHGLPTGEGRAPGARDLRAG